MSSQEQNLRGGKAFFILTLVVFSLVLLVILELSLGYISNSQEIVRIAYKDRHIRLRENPPNSSKTENITQEDKEKNGIFNLKVDQFTVETDQDGFIKPSAVHESPDKKIFFIGGSTTACRVIAAEKRFPYLVGRQLEKLQNNKINSYNAGVSGNHSFHSLNILNNKVLKYSPDIVVLMHNSNDILLIPYGSYWGDAPGKDLVLGEVSQGQDVVEPFYMFPSIRKWASHSTEKISGEKSSETYSKYSKRNGEKVEVNKERVLNQFENSIRSFIKVCQSWDIQPVLMTQVIYTGDRGSSNPKLPEKFDFIMPESPMKDSMMINILFTYHELFNDIIRRIASEESVKLIDLKNAIPANDHEYIYDLYHYNTRGSELVAELVTKELLALLEENESNIIDSLSISMQ